MKNIFSFLLFAALVLISCNNKEERLADSAKAAEYNDSVFAIINQNWNFNIAQINPKVEGRIQRWNQWRAFNKELKEKPKSTLNAFKIKAKNLVTKSDSLTNQIPYIFDKPAVKSRISTLNTKLKSLETYIMLDYIPTQKVIGIIQDVATEVNAIQNQMNEIIVKSEIPKEEGELIMLQALDTARHARREIQEAKSEEKK
ncbi:hypothetical protein LZZ90_12075 [Flavobacterium sp. SM15]|uniref:hypothetical protein n=1 Tax=Flavobacterium sp. SM15 TaxID=2908005 RepID=UPI001EDB216D|nr:hypothetical protein [Flavobacterium sp. SM15]MCG2612243.1 hypothetical protein [Flavobacterium sp. SM15]